MTSIGMGQTVVFAVMPMLGRKLGLHEIVFEIPLLGLSFAPKELAITSLSAVTALTFSVISPWWGRLSDRIGRKKVIILGLFGYTVGISIFNSAAALGLYGVLTGAGLFALLFVTRVFHATVMSASIPASNAYIVDVTGDSNRSQGLSRLAAATQVGSLCGPILTALLAVHFLAPFIFQSLLTAFMGLLLLWFLPKSPQLTYRPGAKKLALGDSRFRWFLLLSLGVYTAFGAVQQTLGFYFQDVLHLTEESAAKWFSIAMIASSGAMLFSQLYLVQRVRLAPMAYVLTGLPIMALGFGILANAETLQGLVLGMGLFGLAMGMIGPNMAAAASFTVQPHEQGGLSGLMASMAGMGFVFGPLLGGYFYGLNIHYPYAGSAVLLLVLAAFLSSYLFFFKKR